MINMIGLTEDLTTEQVLDIIFQDPEVKYGLTEFGDLDKPPYEVLQIYSRVADSGRARGEFRYYLKCLKRGEDIQVLSENKSNPEEIIRQLWLYKLHHVYDYPFDHIAVEYQVVFGTVTAEKAADIVVFQQDGRTPKIIFEIKRPDRKDGINQLKSYLNAEGSPVGVWSNGQERIILYRPYPRQFEDTLTEIPTFHQEPRDVLASKLYLSNLRREFDFKRIIQNIEELVLANAGVDEFSEIFKIIFAKIFDETFAQVRRNQEVTFRKSDDPQITYDTINKLFRRALEEWPSIFDEAEQIKLTPQHLQVVIGPLERIYLLGANMRVMDDAFEYLMPSVAKKKNGQFFTPRYVIDMCVKMMNPTKREYILDPACGSAGFLIHTMEHVWPASDDAKREERKHNYAAKYLWGMDFDERSSRVARALMLIAGDGRSHVFRVNALDPREWFTSQEGETIRSALREANLLTNKPPTNKIIKEVEAWDFYRDMKFDLILTNPPFAGEIRDRDLLRRYDLAERALTRPSPKEERDVLFIERCIRLLKPGGRLAIVLPQGKLNNLKLTYIREWILHHARLLAVVGLHPNTFKPHTGTKTSVLFVQKYTGHELTRIQSEQDSIRENCPDYRKILRGLIAACPEGEDLVEENIPEEVRLLLLEWFDDREGEVEVEPSDRDAHEVPENSIEILQNESVELGKTIANLNTLLKRATENKDRDNQRKIKTQLREVERKLARVITKLKHHTLKGRVELLLENPQALEELRQRWIDIETAKNLDYPVFMATSEQGGKDSSGSYRYRTVSLTGVILEDWNGDPLIEQDCVKYRDEDPDVIAEQFIKWAKKQKLSFWLEG